MIIVDAAKPEEHERVLEITLAAYREYEKDAGPGFWARYSESIRRSIQEDASATILVARDEAGEIKGSALFYESIHGPAFDNDLPEMRLLAVPPEGRNLGVAGLIIEECERRAASFGALTLHTTRLMTTAKAMYERRGYVRFPDIDFEPVPGFVVWGFKKPLERP